MIKPTITSTQSKAARAALGISQSKVAGATGINRSQIALFEVKKFLFDEEKLNSLRTYYEGLGYEFERETKTSEDAPRSVAMNEAQPPLGDAKVIDRFLVPAGVEDEALESLLAEIDLNDQKIVELAQQGAKFDWFGEPNMEASQEILRLMALNYVRVRQLQIGGDKEQGPADAVKPSSATVGNLVEKALGLRLSVLVEA